MLYAKIIKLGQHNLKNYAILFCILITICCFTIYFTQIYGQEISNKLARSEGDTHPYIFDSRLKIEQVVEGLNIPTTMAFLGPNDFLVLEKDKGTVIRVHNGIIENKPLLDVNVANSMERGMCGIAVSKNGSKTYVFLYFTQIDGKDGSDKQGNIPVGNRLYRYELVNDTLLNPKLLLDIPATPGPIHNGGAIEIGPDKNIYVPVGDINGSFVSSFRATQTQNSYGGIDADGRSGILRVTQDGKPVGEGILGDSMPLRLYYAYGIRNSFGLGFDPLTRHLWDTENGPDSGDEINLVNPGFNSGWHHIYGFSSDKKFHTESLITFNNKGKYEEPKLVWAKSAGLTAIVFLKSDKLGTQYENDIFVGDVHNGQIYHFDLNDERTDLALPELLADRHVQNTTVNYGSGDFVFGKGFGGVTDLTVGPDGYLYVVSIGEGKVYRILPQ